MFGFRRTFFNDPVFASFRQMGRLVDQMDRYLAQSQENTLHAGSGFPLVDVWTGQDGAILSAEIPGVAAEDLEVTVLGDTLTIRGKRPAPELGEREGYVRQERFTGEFVRTVQLPFAVDPEQVKAEHKNGVLTVQLTRPAADRPRRIAIGDLS